MIGRASESFRKCRFRPRLEAIEPRTVPAAGFRAVPDDAIAVGPDDGGIPEVSIVNPATGEDIDTVEPFPAAFRGGVRTALGDVTGDGVRDIIVAPGVGGVPHVIVIDGATGDQVANIPVYEESFTGGLYVAAGDVNNDGRDDLITGTGNGGGPRVKVLDGATLGATVLKDFFAYEDRFRGGVIVAAGDLDGDGKDDVITGTGVGGGPRVIAFSGADDHPLQNFFAYEDAFRGGVLVSAGDVDGDGRDDIITGTGPGGGPVVRVVGGDDLHELRHFLADDDAFRGGVRVEAEDVNHDGRDDVIARTRHGDRDDVRMFDDADDVADGSLSRTVDDNPNAGADDNLPPPPTNPVTPVGTELEGTVTAIDAAAGTLTLRLENGSTAVVRTGASTRFERNGVTATFSSFQVGDRAEAVVGSDSVAIVLEARTTTSGNGGPGSGSSGPGSDDSGSGGGSDDGSGHH